MARSQFEPPTQSFCARRLCCEFQSLARDDLDTATGAVSLAGGGDTVELGQGEMDDAAIASVHRLKRDSAAFVEGSLGFALSEGLEVLVVAVSVVTGVDDDVSAAVGVTVEDLVEQELQRVEGLTLLADGSSGVFTDDVEDNALVVFTDVDIHVEFHELKDLVEELRRVFGLAVASLAVVAGVAGASWSRFVATYKEGAVLGFVLSHCVVSSYGSLVSGALR